MYNESSSHDVKKTLRSKAENHTKESVNLCYQCGKCSAGCPLIDEMDFAPNQILRMLQLDNEKIDEKVLNSYAIWLCLSCEMCYSRCPQNVNLPEIMDYLRSESYNSEKINPKAKDIIAFHRSFLDSIKTTGRLYEVGLIAEYKMRTMHLMQDVDSAPSLYMKGKLNILPHIIKNREAMTRIFHKVEEMKGENL